MDDSSLYAAVLILNLTYNKKYIYNNWDPKWIRPVLGKVQKLWETYQENASPGPPIITTSYDAAKKKPEKELDIFNEIAWDLTRHIRPASQDEYQDYTLYFDQIVLGKLIALQW